MCIVECFVWCQVRSGLCRTLKTLEQEGGSKFKEFRNHNNNFIDYTGQFLATYFKHPNYLLSSTYLMKPFITKLSLYGKTRVIARLHSAVCHEVM